MLPYGTTSELPLIMQTTIGKRSATPRITAPVVVVTAARWQASTAYRKEASIAAAIVAPVCYTTVLRTMLASKANRTALYAR